MFFQGEFLDFSVESGRKGRPSEVKKNLRPTGYINHAHAIARTISSGASSYSSFNSAGCGQWAWTRQGISITMQSAFAGTILGYQLTVIRTGLATSSSNNEPQKKFLPHFYLCSCIDLLLFRLCRVVACQ